MDAIRFTLKTLKLELAKVDIPKVTKPNEVLIKVAYAGVCGTDLHIIQGHFPCSQTTVTLGHEFSGTVEAVGSDVKNIKVGDIVSVNPNDSCNFCTPCKSGNPHYCTSGGIDNTIGIFKDGGFASYVISPIQQVHKLPDSITLEQGALAEPISCLAHGWDLVSPISVGKRVLVIGAGIIGNLWVCLLHLQGHRKVTVSEPNQKRLELLKKLNTGYNLITPDELKKNQQADPTYLFDVIIDSSGYAPAIEHATTLLEKGGKMCCFGIAGQNDTIRIKPFELYKREAKIFGVLINPFTFPKSIGFLEAMGDRYLNYENLGIKVYPVTKYQEAFDALKSGTISKAIFKL